jgi:hypothetical protein
MDQLDSAEGTSRNLLEDKDELRAGRSIEGDPSRDKVKEEEHLMSSEEIFTDEGEKENSFGRSAELQEDPRMVRGDPDSSNQILFENNEELPDSQGQDEKTKPDPISANLDESKEASEEKTDNEDEEELTDKPALFKLMEDEGISWIELFYMIDVKKRGSISGMELYLDLVREMGCTKPLAYQILKEIDLDMDAFITVNEWISYENKLPKDLQQNSVHKGADIIQKLLVQLKANDMRVLEVFREASQYEDVSQLSTIVLMRFLTDTLKPVQNERKKHFTGSGPGSRWLHN